MSGRFLLLVVILIVCVIGFFVAHRSPRLRRYQRVILAIGVVTFAAILYLGWDDLSAGFIDGFLPWRSVRGSGG